MGRRGKSRSKSKKKSLNYVSVFSATNHQSQVSRSRSQSKPPKKPRSCSVKSNKSSKNRQFKPLQTRKKQGPFNINENGASIDTNDAAFESKISGMSPNGTYDQSLLESTMEKPESNQLPRTRIIKIKRKKKKVVRNVMPKQPSSQEKH